MEHLPLPAGVKPFIIVPYEAPKANWYDNKGFVDYPQRCNWTEEQLRGGDDITKEDYLDKNGFHTKGKSTSIEQFFQTWLFFGLVIEFLKLGGVHVTTDDFLVDRVPDGESTSMPKMVNTSKLPALLIEWRNGVGNSRKTWKTLESMFERSKSVLDRFCCSQEHENWPLTQRKSRKWPVRDAISTTMIALTFSLRRAALNAGYQEGSVDVISPWLKARSEILWKRLEQKWCLADVTTIFKEVAIDGHYYFAASPGLVDKELDHHSRCVKEHCLYDYDSEMYVTRHAAPPWHKPGCKTTIQYGGQLGPERGQKGWVDAICKIIDKNAIPIALWLKGRRTLWSVEYHLTGNRQPDYVAVSHVWTDGKGNPKANSLPECQLDRITHYVENIHWEGRKPVPEDPNLSDGIGFWMDTLCIPVDDKKRKHDAIVNMRHVYSRAKAVLVLDDWLQEISSEGPMLDIVARVYQSNWLKRLWTHQEGFLPENVYVQFSDRSVHIDDLRNKYEAYEKQQKAVGIYLQFPWAAKIHFLDLYSALKRMMKNVDSTKPKWQLYLPLANVMSERKTARLTDETVCLATIIDMPVQHILEISDKKYSDAKEAQMRMAYFLKQLHQFNMSVVFNNYSRHEEKGLKWAPKSLLNFRTPSLVIDGGDNLATLQEINGYSGLLVEYPGFLVKFANGKPSFGAIQRGCVIKCRGNKTVDGRFFIIELPPNNVEWLESASQQYAIVLSSIPKHGQSVPAIVGLTDTAIGRGIHGFDHCSIATARVEDASPAWVETIEATLLASDTQWLVM